eukprot:Opistho-2@26520
MAVARRRVHLLPAVAACVCVCVLALVAAVAAVDRSNFKTCDQSGFCKRNRNMATDQSLFKVLPESIKAHQTSMSMDLVNTQTSVLFTLDILLLDQSMVRFKVAEKTPLKPRYEVKDVVVGDAPGAPLDSVEENDGDFAVRSKDITVFVTHSPFRIDILHKEALVLRLNARGLMNFEHTRARDDGHDTAADGEGAWDESFKTHRDSKPNGPQSVAMDVTFTNFEHVYGIPEHASRLSLPSTKGPGITSDPYRLYNLDVFEYELDNPMALYGSIPFMVAHSETRTAGFFWLNAAETWVDVTHTQGASGTLGRLVSFMKGRSASTLPSVDTHWMSESGIIDAYVLLGPTPTDVFRQYATLTGMPQLPPLFSIAYHQCRWNYNDQQDVASVDGNFDRNDIPYDVLWLDIEHTDGKRYFTWDYSKFPDPVAMQEVLAQKGRKMVTIVDPHIKRDSGYEVHSESESLGLYVKTTSGSSYEGWCWPGSSSWLDFTARNVRDWWAGRFALDKYKGSTTHLYIWNDMNEPSVFNGPEISMHKDAIHEGGWEHRDVHNVYGFYQHMATAQGLAKRSGYHRRPFVLSRAFFAGSQRHGAIWTGDNTADWDHLRASLPMIMSIGVAGLPFAGADVGGFFKNPDSQLLVRWYQTGAYTPFFRAHAHLDTRRREPWLFDDATTLAIRKAVIARYQLLPLFYTLFHEASVTGKPVMRPLWVEFPGDKATFGLQDAFLVGSSLLVKPVAEPNVQSVDVYLPGDQPWYDVDTYESFVKSAIVRTPLTKIPVFQRGGAIVVRKMRLRRSSALMDRDPYTLIVTLNLQGAATGSLYVDDGDSFAYVQGNYALVDFEFGDNQLVARPRHGADFVCNAVERIIVVGLAKLPATATLKDANDEHAVPIVVESTNRIVVKKPGVDACREWSIVFGV